MVIFKESERDVEDCGKCVFDKSAAYGRVRCTDGYYVDDKKPRESTQLTKREQYAAMAMQGLLSNDSLQYLYGVACRSFEIADVMIKEGEK